MKCKQCGEKLTNANTSCMSQSEEMCQECHTEMIENIGWK